MDFEKAIRAELAKGISMQDIAKNMDNAMNKIRTEKSEALSKRQEAVNKYEELFHNHYKNEHCDVDTVGALAVLVCESDYPDWTAEDIDTFYKNIVWNVKKNAELIKSGEMAMNFFDSNRWCKLFPW